MDPLWSFADFVAAIGGSIEADAPDISGISIDTRTLCPGDAYFAILGDVHDGHKFVDDAFAAGASVAVVAKDYQGGGALLRVDDTLGALAALGMAARARSSARIIAVTGSVGKTGAKEALKLALAPGGEVHASDKSYNNQWGVPLSLARMPSSAKYGVFEIGMNHPGEITPLVKLVRPHVVLITTVEPVHIGFFKSVDDIAAAKAEIFDGLEPGGIAVLNQDNAYFSFLKKRAMAGCAGDIIGFGENEGAEARLEKCTLHENGSDVSALICGQRLGYEIGAPGRHMVMNSLGVMAGVAALGGELASAALALADMRPPQGRGARVKLVLNNGQAMLIDESYNANPASMRAALSVLSAMNCANGGRRIAVLGDMLELGEFAGQLHAELAEQVIGARVDIVFACGEHMAQLWDKIPQAMRGAYSPSAAGLRDELVNEIRGGDVVMIKGSLGSKMGPLAEALEKRYPKA